MRGYKVLYRVHGKLVSKADKRLVYPAVVGQVVKMPPPGIFLSTKKQYVLDYYSDGPDAEYDEPGMEEVLLTLEFSPKDILRGNLTDEDPEAAVSSARVVAIEPTAHVVHRDLKPDNLPKRASNPRRGKPAKVLSLQAHRNKLAHEHRLKINKIKNAYLQAFWHLGYEPLRTKKGDVNTRSFNMLKDIAGHLYDTLDESHPDHARRGNPAEVVSLAAFKADRARAQEEAKIVDVLSRIARRAQGIDPETPDAQEVMKFAAKMLIDGHAKGWFLRSNEDRLKPLR